MTAKKEDMDEQLKKEMLRLYEYARMMNRRDLVNEDLQKKLLDEKLKKVTDDMVEKRTKERGTKQ